MNRVLWGLLFRIDSKSQMSSKEKVPLQRPCQGKLPTRDKNLSNPIFREKDTSALAGFHAGPLTRSNYNLEMLVFVEGGKPEKPKKKQQSRPHWWEASTLTIALSLLPHSVKTVMYWQMKWWTTWLAFKFWEQFDNVEQQCRVMWRLETRRVDL